MSDPANAPPPRPARSLRATIQAWNALLVVGVVVLFGGLTYAGARHARMEQFDTQLRADAEVAAGRVRPVRSRFDGLSGSGPPRDGRDPGSRDPNGRGELRVRLELPDDLMQRFVGGVRPGAGAADGADAAEAADGADAAYGAGAVGRAGSAERGTYLVVFRADGTVALASPLAPADVPAPAGATPAAIERSERRGDAGPGGGPGGSPPGPAYEPYLRQRGELREVVADGPFGTAVVAGRSVAFVRAELNTLLGLTAAGGLAVTALGLLGGWLLARGATAPIEVMARDAASIDAADLSRRLDAGAASAELAGLAGVLNGAFGRLEAAFERQARFTADASHELRTPLSVVFSHAELALARERSPAEYRAALETCLRAARRMRSLVESLLTLARADAGRLDLARAPLDLADVAADAADLLRALAAERDVAVAVDTVPTLAVGDAGRLGQCVTNLIANAVHYNRPGGRVDVRVRTEGDAAVVEVADTGVGVSDADAPHLFDRFYRADKARARPGTSGGSGLGLAICREVAHAHGGTIALAPTPAGGTVFTLRLPAAAADGVPSEGCAMPERIAAAELGRA